MNLRPALPRAGLALPLLAAIAWAVVNRQRFDAGAVMQGIADLGAYGPLAYMGLYVAASVLVVPGSILGLVGGAIFGPVWGAVNMLAGATVEATLTFLLVRYVASDWIAAEAGAACGRSSTVSKARVGGSSPSPGWCRCFPATSSTTRSGSRASGNHRAAGDGLSWIEAGALADRLQRDLAPIVVDMRAVEEFGGALGHIHAARNIPLAELPDRVAELARFRERELAVVCRRQIRSAKAAATLTRAGLRNVAVPPVGMVAWNQRHLPLQGGDSAPQQRRYDDEGTFCPERSALRHRALL